MLTYKKLVPVLQIECAGSKHKMIDRAIAYDNNGADGILFQEEPGDDHTHDEAIGVLKEICREIDIPVLAGGMIKRLEDVKKYLYAGAAGVYFCGKDENQEKIIKEACDRFGAKRCYIWEDGVLTCAASGNLLKKISYSEEAAADVLSAENELTGLILETEKEIPDFFACKKACEAKGLPMNTFRSTLSFSEFKTDEKGLVPVVVQDYKNAEVLMVAYMNEEAFQKTCETGRMTYFSRSRQSLWVKGETSGHYQYVKELCIDCDNDTVLAKVKQVGAACHTGNRSCFYRTLAAKEYAQANPLLVLEHVYDVIEDRRLHPKEGSYTNYLFDKGIDKILKKVGEEATEIVIAAKNPDSEEVKYEIADFLYHMMVLMSERGVTWSDITKELANRE